MMKTEHFVDHTALLRRRLEREANEARRQERIKRILAALIVIGILVIWWLAYQAGQESMKSKIKTDSPVAAELS